MTKELIALVDTREMGRVARDRSGKLSFTYEDAWRKREGLKHPILGKLEKILSARAEHCRKLLVG